MQSPETSEAFAFHQAVKWTLTQTHSVTIYFDCVGAGFAAAELASPSAETRTIALATRALVHYAEAHGFTIHFTHVHSHQGHGLNELVDNVAKAGADCVHGSGLLYLLDQGWYSPTSGVPE